MMVAAACTLAANAEPFTYQGQLNDGGMPANGTYNIKLEVTDAAIGGNLIGSGFNFTNVPVVDGLFELEFDPGDIFTSQDVWLQVTIAENGNAVTLTPNTKITATPKAQHASVADTALNAPWTVAPGIITYGDGDDQVFINRTNAITPSEFFGVHGTNNLYNGMYISGPADSRPFYGYSTDGSVNAYHYYNSSTDEWVLITNLDESIRIDAQNEMTIANKINADAYRYKSPKTQVLSISGNVFHSSSGNEFIASSGGAFFTDPGAGTLVAPVQLPQGAVLQSMTAYVGDVAAESVAVSLRHEEHGGTTSIFIFYANSISMSGSNLQLTDTTPQPDFQVVDNYTGHYHLAAYSQNWPGTSGLRISSVVIEYTIEEVD